MSFRAWSMNLLLAALATSCAIRPPQMHFFVLEINGPTPGDFEGSYTAATGKTAKNAKEVRFQSTDFAQRPIVIQARARSFAFQLANNGDEALKMKLVVDGKDSGNNMLLPPGKLWASKYEPANSSRPAANSGKQ